MQSRKMSLIETSLSTAIGYIVALLTQMIVFPWFDIEVSHSQGAAIAGLFTVVSVMRGYAVRRLFNWLGLRKPAPTPKEPAWFGCEDGFHAWNFGRKVCLNCKVKGDGEGGVLT